VTPNEIIEAEVISWLGEHSYEKWVSDDHWEGGRSYYARDIADAIHDAVLATVRKLDDT
jgi:hypothetical protein